MTIELLRDRDVEVGRATPVGSSSSYKVIDCTVLPVKPVRKTLKSRAIHLSDSAKHDLEVVGVLLPFTVLFALDFACVALWAAIPGSAVIMAAMFISVLMLAEHSNHPGKR